MSQAIVIGAGGHTEYETVALMASGFDWEGIHEYLKEVGVSNKCLVHLVTTESDNDLFGTSWFGVLLKNAVDALRDLGVRHIVLNILDEDPESDFAREKQCVAKELGIQSIVLCGDQTNG